jgi:GDPmannose 4,6-dehydratase
MPDISVVTPVFVDGRPRFFTANIGHHADVGGRVPGSIAADALSVFEEGIRIPATRIRRAGELDRGMLRLVAANTREPEERRVDQQVRAGESMRVETPGGGAGPPAERDPARRQEDARGGKVRGVSRTALITGITGQDGAYLARFLLAKGYRVVGARRSRSDPWRLRELKIAGEVEYVELDLVTAADPAPILNRLKPDEVYNLAAQSSVALSFERPLETAEADAIGPLRLLEAVRQVLPAARVFQASSCDMFGAAATGAPLDETTPFRPKSPYGIAKLFAHAMTVAYRERHGIAAASGILFNHESPLRGPEFVTRKITRTLARIRRGAPEVLELGNLDAARDWGFAGDYVEAMWLMQQHAPAEDFVLATGKAHTVREFVEAAAGRLGLALEWSGDGLDEQAVDRRTGKAVVRVNPQFYRPVEAATLIGNAARAESVLGWRPATAFAEVVGMMAEADDRRVRDAIG